MQEDTEDTDTFTKLGESRALRTLESGLALARQTEAEKAKKLIEADQRMKLMKERRATFRRLLAKL